MPRMCTICHHRQREAIDQDLVDEKPYRHIAARFQVSTGALQRHNQDHLPPHLCQAKAAQEVSQADGLLAQLQHLTTETQAILREARTGASKDPELALGPYPEARAAVAMALLQGSPDVHTSGTHNTGA